MKLSLINLKSKNILGNVDKRRRQLRGVEILKKLNEKGGRRSLIADLTFAFSKKSDFFLWWMFLVIWKTIIKFHKFHEFQEINVQLLFFQSKTTFFIQQCLLFRTVKITFLFAFFFLEFRSICCFKTGLFTLRKPDNQNCSQTKNLRHLEIKVARSMFMTWKTNFTDFSFRFAACDNKHFQFVLNFLRTK